MRCQCLVCPATHTHKKAFLQYCSSIRFYRHPRPRACYTYAVTRNTATFARFPRRLWWWKPLCFHLWPKDTTFTMACAVSEQQQKAKTIPTFHPNQLKQFPVFIQTSWNNSQFLSKPVETIPSFYPNQLKQFPVFIQTSWNNFQFLFKPVETISSFHPNQLKQFPVFPHTYSHYTASHNT